jgi:hypothetical protein
MTPASLGPVFPESMSTIRTAVMVGTWALSALGAFQHVLHNFPLSIPHRSQTKHIHTD